MPHFYQQATLGTRAVAVYFWLKVNLLGYQEL